MLNFCYASIKQRELAELSFGLKKIQRKRSIKQITGTKMTSASMNKCSQRLKHLKRKQRNFVQKRAGSSNPKWDDLELIANCLLSAL